MGKLPKIIGTDLDGTLLTSDGKTVSPRTFEILAKCIENGSFLVPITGRVLSMVPLDKFPEVRYVISSNGALITDRKEDRYIRTRYILKEDLQKFWEAIEPIMIEHHLAMEIFENGELVVEKSLYENVDDYFDVLPNFHYEKIKSGEAKIVNSYMEYFEKEGEQVVKINFPGKTCKKAPWIKDVVKEIALLDITSDGLNLECGPKGCNKGEALQWLCDYLNVSKEESVCFGDGNNDLQMLQAAGYGVAMGNALETTKQVAGYTTLSNDEDGIAYFLETHFMK